MHHISQIHLKFFAIVGVEFLRLVSTNAVSQIITKQQGDLIKLEQQQLILVAVGYGVNKWRRSSKNLN